MRGIAELPALLLPLVNVGPPDAKGIPNIGAVGADEDIKTFGKHVARLPIRLRVTGNQPLQFVQQMGSHGLQIAHIRCT
jgi:hypothetical protein